MKVKATKAFKASINGAEYACKAGAAIEADARTIEKLKALGLAEDAAPKTRKAEEDD